MDLKSALKDLIKGDIVDDPKTLLYYSHDASIFRIFPKLVIFPKDVGDIRDLINFINSPGNHHLSLTPRSAGSDMTGGALGDSIVLDFTRYINRIKEIGPEFAVAEPGVFYRDFEKETLKRHLLMPSYPASKNLAAIGGIVANNAGGEKTLTYGKTEKYVKALKVVLSDGFEYTFHPLNHDQLKHKMSQNDFEGEIYRQVFELVHDNKKLLDQVKPKVSKNSSGYFLWNVWDGKTFDLTKLFVGSQGTLGIITEVKFRLVKTHPQTQMITISMDNLQNLAEIVNEVLSHHPETFECFDDKTLNFAIKYNIFARVKTLFTGVPRLVLLTEFVGDSKEELLEKARLTVKNLEKFKLKTKIIKDRKEADKIWEIRRRSFGLLMKHSKGMIASPFIDDIIVRPEVLPEFLPKLEKILQPYSGRMVHTLAGHIGDGNFHIIPLVDLKKPGAGDMLQEIMDKVFDLVFKYGGSMSAEHSDGLIRTPYLKKMYGEKVVKLFEGVKEIFDPKGIFNPGKKVNGSKTYAFSHLKKKI